jgi:peptidoglycan lytic transglycosylase
MNLVAMVSRASSFGQLSSLLNIFFSMHRKRILVALPLTIIGLTLAGCGSILESPAPVTSNPPLVEYGDPVPRGGGIYKVGNPYQIAGNWFYPREDENYDETGIASWYGRDFHGRRTANGEIYDMDALTAAHPTLPLPIYARVINLQNNREIVVRINDRGPYASDRIIDLSKMSAEALGFSEQGTTRVRVTYLGRAPLDGDDSWETRLYERTRGQPNSLANVDLPGTAGQNAPNANTQLASLGPAANNDITGSLPSRLYVQAGSFRDAARANRLSAQLSSVDAASISTVNVGNLTYYRVRLGPYAAPATAENVRQQVIAAGIQGARIVPLD